MGTSMTEPLETPGASGEYPVHTAPLPTAVKTTLYDLIAALSAEVGPDEDEVLTATVVHLLQTHRVMYTCGRARYRLVWDGPPTTARTTCDSTVGVEERDVIR